MNDRPIEAEAASPAALDAERLGTAMHNIGVTLCDDGGPGSSLDDVAAEYARLTEQEGYMAADRPTTEPQAMREMTPDELLAAFEQVAHYPRMAIERERAAQGAAPRAEGLDTRLRLAAERVIASFDWEEGPLPIITDDALAFGNAVNRLRDALASRPSDERVPESEEPR